MSIFLLKIICSKHYISFVIKILFIGNTNILNKIINKLQLVCYTLFIFICHIYYLCIIKSYNWDCTSQIYISDFVFSSNMHNMFVYNLLCLNAKDPNKNNSEMYLQKLHTH